MMVTEFRSSLLAAQREGSYRDRINLLFFSSDSFVTSGHQYVWMKRLHHALRKHSASANAISNEVEMIYTIDAKKLPLFHTKAGIPVLPAMFPIKNVRL
jgi:hypothetical protein